MFISVFFYLFILGHFDLLDASLDRDYLPSSMAYLLRSSCDLLSFVSSLIFSSSSSRISDSIIKTQNSRLLRLQDIAQYPCRAAGAIRLALVRVLACRLASHQDSHDQTLRGYTFKLRYQNIARYPCASTIALLRASSYIQDTPKRCDPSRSSRYRLRLIRLQDGPIHLGRSTHSLWRC
jgi:hypothetical protein